MATRPHPRRAGGRSRALCPDRPSKSIAGLEGLDRIAPFALLAFTPALDPPAVAAPPQAHVGIMAELGPALLGPHIAPARPGGIAQHQRRTRREDEHPAG